MRIITPLFGIRITNLFFYSSHHQQPIYFTPRRQGAKTQSFPGVLIYFAPLRDALI